MTTDNFNLKQGDPIIAENAFGKTAGYYRETVEDEKGIWIRFNKLKDKTSGGSYIRHIDNVKSATNADVEKILDNK